MNERIRVLLIDDHEMARRGLRAMLSAADWIDVVGEGDSCESGLGLAETLQPDMVLLDIRMPGIDGLACLERLKAGWPRIAVVIVTLYDDRRYVLEAIRRGAAGYLLKDATTAEVIQTLRNVADGQLAVEPQLLREALATRDEVASDRPDGPPAGRTVRPDTARARRSPPGGRGADEQGDRRPPVRSPRTRSRSTSRTSSGSFAPPIERRRPSWRSGSAFSNPRPDTDSALARWARQPRACRARSVQVPSLSDRCPRQDRSGPACRHVRPGGHPP